MERLDIERELRPQRQRSHSLAKRRRSRTRHGRELPPCTPVLYLVSFDTDWRLKSENFDVPKGHEGPEMAVGQARGPNGRKT